MSVGLHQSWHEATTPGAKMQSILHSTVAQDWQAFGSYLARVRQTRRRMKTRLLNKCNMRNRHNIQTVIKEWRREGKHVCRHDVFFSAAISSVDCPCLLEGSIADWSGAVLMPALNHDLKCITTDTFNRVEFRRLGQVQAEARRLNYF